MKQVLRFVFPATCFCLFLYLSSYKVGNTDFWWHIKAGQLLRETGWIVTDPFAYTRAGELYIANHEWLSQIILSFVYDVLGSTGIIVLRTFMVAVIFGLPLLLDRSRVGLNSGLALLAAILARPALTDRPQLFTFLMFSAVMYLCLAYLDAKKADLEKYTLALPIVFLLWSNLHGAAGIIGLSVLGALGIQRIAAKADRKEITILLTVGLLSCLTLIATPSGFDNITYALRLMGDKTTGMIAEWQTPTWPAYLWHVGIFWAIALAAVWKGKRDIVFSTLVLLGIGYLSKSAVRHEVLFLITALAVTIHQLKAVEMPVLQRVTKKVVCISLFLLLAGCTFVQSARFNIRDNLFGIGEFTPLKGASTFIQKAGITGNMFNNYKAGGEMLFRDHKVFLDGRNLDYGYDYISRAVDAGEGMQKWNELSQEYNFSHAVIYYSLEASQNQIPYIDILQEDPRWGLQYLDDWSAVFVRGEGGAISQLTPKMLFSTLMPEEISLRNLQVLQSEVNGIIEACPECTKAPAYKKEMLRAFGS